MNERMTNAGGGSASGLTNTTQQTTVVRPTFSIQEIDKAKANQDLVKLIGARIPLTREGQEWRGLCPFHIEKTPSFSVVPQKGFYHCFGCGAHGDALTWMMQMENKSFREAVETGLQRPVTRPINQLRVIRTAMTSAGPAKPPNDYEKQRKLNLAARIWNESRPAIGTLVERYLFTRCLVYENDMPNVLRFHPSLIHEPTRQYFPVMVAAVHNANGEFTGIHRTYLAPDGSGKATVTEGGVKRMLGDCFGAHVQFTPPQNNKLAIAEGIETALSIMQSCPDYGVWSAMSLGNLKAPVPKTVGEIVICADGDNKDPRMAERILREAADDHINRGHTVLVARPPQGMDFNDLLQQT
jgi:phage/plasmid primase-like uncharacterized protein